MATKVMIASVRLQADASQYTAEYLKAGRVVEDFSARVSVSTEAASKSAGKLRDELKKIPTELVPALNPVVPKLDEIPAALNKTTISAKQTAAALRGVPAQFTDIVTSLQGGQSPLTVFIQQGGQLKDMFGGAGNAARALGGYVAGLATVTTVSSTLIGGAIVGVALAYNQGSKEADAYVRSIVMTGNAAGTTVGQLQALAGSVSTAANVTKGASAEALAALVGDGNTAADMLERAAGTTVMLQRDAGIAVSETVKQFSELGKEPVAASIKLNDQYHFLTTAVYQQIKALDEQGKKEDAAALAQKTYADAMDYRSAQLRANLGTIERAWGGVRSAASKAWDAMLDVGRADSKIDELAAVRKQIAANDAAIARGVGGESVPGIGLLIRTTTAALKDQNTQLRAKEAALAGVVAGQKANADQEAVSAKQTAARTAWDKEGEKFLSKKAQMERELTAARNEATAAGATQAELETRLGQIREKFKEKGASTAAGQSELANLRARTLAEQQYVDQLKAHGEQAVKVTEGDRLVLQYQEQLKGKLDAKTRSAKEALLAEAENLAAVQRSKDVEVERQKVLAASKATHEKLIEATGKAADSIREQADKQEAANATLGKGKTAIEQMTLATLKYRLQEAEWRDNHDPKYVASLREQIKEQERWVKALNSADFNALINKEQEWLDQAKERASLYENEVQLAGLTNLERAKIVATRQVELRLAKELDDINKSGVSEAQKEAARLKAREAAEIDSSAAVNKVVQDDWSKTTDQINQSLTDAIMGGGKSGGEYIEDYFRTMVLRPTISAIMQPVSMVINGAVNSGLNAVGLGNGSSGLGSILNTGSNLASLFGGNTVSNMVGSGLGWLTGATAANTAIGTGLGLGAASSGAAASAAAAAGGTSMMGALGAAMPYVGLALAAVSLLKGVGKGETRSGGQYGVAFDGAVINNRRGETYTEVGQQYNRNNSTGVSVTNGRAYLMEADGVGANDAKVKAALESTAAGINAMLKGMGSSMALAQFFGGFETSGKGRGGVMSGGKFADGTTFGESGTGDNYAGTFYEKFSSNSPNLEEALANFSTDLLQTSIQALQKATDAPETIKKKIKDVDAESLTSEEAQAILTDIGNTIAGVENLRAAVKKLPFDNLADMGFDAAAGLIELSGGIDSLGGKLSSYYNNFYSESERQANALKNVQSAMKDLGHADVDTRAEFRALWESADPKTEAGAKLIAQLLEIESAFAAVYPAATDAAAAAATLAETIEKLRNPTRTIDDTARNTVDLENQAWELENEGNIAALRERQTRGWTDAERALQAHIWALESEKKAANERLGLERQLMQLNGDTAGIRALERAELSETNRALYDQIRAREDERDALAEMLNTAGVSADSLGTIIRDGLLGRMSAEDVGAKMSDMVIGGIYNAVASSASTQISGMFVDTIITPMLTAVTTGGVISTAVSQASIDAVVANAVNAANAISAIVADPGFRAALDAVSVAIRGIAGAAASTNLPRTYTTAWDGASAAGVSGADSVKDAWLSASKSISDEIKRMRGETAGKGQQGTAYAQAQFAIASAAARAGDLDAFKSLPELNKTLLDLAAANSGSLIELRRVQAAQIASLEQTNAIAAKKYGFKVPAFANGGTHLGGARLVGEFEPELEVTGPSRIYNANQMRSMLSGDGESHAEVAAELRAVRSVLEQMLGTSKEGTGYMKTLDHNFAKVSKRGPNLSVVIEQ